MMGDLLALVPGDQGHGEFESSEDRNSPGVGEQSSLVESERNSPGVGEGGDSRGRDLERGAPGFATGDRSCSEGSTAGVYGEGRPVLPRANVAVSKDPI